MKRRLLLTVVFAGIAVSSWALWVSACDQSKSASAASADKSAASHCASKSDASAASAAECAGHSKNATASAKGDHCAGKSSASAASTKLASGSCCMKGAKNTTASAEGDHCAGKSSASAASTKPASGSCCSKDSKNTTADAGMSTCSQGLAFAGVLAMPAGGPACSQGKKAARDSHSEHMDGCDACSDMASSSEELKTHGTQTQVVALKNGVMFVYTAASANSVRAVQAAMVRRGEKLNAISAAGDRASLCPECRTIRGAMASGKMTRETINIEGGCLTLFTSTDPAMVKKLRGMSSAQSNRMKS